MWRTPNLSLTDAADCDYLYLRSVTQDYKGAEANGQQVALHWQIDKKEKRWESEYGLGALNSLHNYGKNVLHRDN